MFPLHLESQADQTDEKSQKMHAQWMARNLAVELLVLHTAPSCLAQKHLHVQLNVIITSA